MSEPKRPTTSAPTNTELQFCGYGSCDRTSGHDTPHRCRCGRLVDESADGCMWHTRPEETR